MFEGLEGQVPYDMGSGAILGLRVKVQVRNARAPEDLVVDLIGKDLAQYATKSRNRRTSQERSDMLESWSDSGSLLVLISHTHFRNPLACSRWVLGPLKGDSRNKRSTRVLHAQMSLEKP